MSDDEQTILSAMVLQKGEAEAAEIFRESPAHLRDYTILKGVNSYAALGRYYLANETTPTTTMGWRILPVSYPHLDVYKRQSLCVAK